MGAPKERTIVAWGGPLTGLCIFGLFQYIVFPMLEKQGPNSPQGCTAFQREIYAHTGIEYFDQFLCFIVSFFQRGVQGPTALAVFLPLGMMCVVLFIRMADVMAQGVCVTVPKKPQTFKGMWDPSVYAPLMMAPHFLHCAFVAFWCQLLGIGVAFPAIYLPLYGKYLALLPDQQRVKAENRNELAPANVALTVVLGTAITLVPMLGLVFLEPASELWQQCAALFQPAPILMFFILRFLGSIFLTQGHHKSNGGDGVRALYATVALIGAASHTASLGLIIQGGEDGFRDVLTDGHRLFFVVDLVGAAAGAALLVVADGGNIPQFVLFSLFAGVPCAFASHCVTLHRSGTSHEEDIQPVIIKPAGASKPSGSQKKRD
eukprot:Clim_evm2s232 gene=Clim_evmTU2s232